MGSWKEGGGRNEGEKEEKRQKVGGKDTKKGNKDMRKKENTEYIFQIFPNFVGILTSSVSLPWKWTEIVSI